MNLSNVAAVIFDMDGLLVDSERLANRALVQTARAFGIEPDADIFAGMIGLPEDASANLLRCRFGHGFDAGKFIHAAAEACEALVATGHLQPKPGAVEFVECLNRYGVPKAVATSSARAKAVYTLSQTALLDRFDAIVTRTDVARGKPHPDLFLRAASELGIATAQCIALEDSYNGVRAAHASGMRVIMVPDLLPPTNEMSQLTEAILPDLFAAMDAFRRSSVVKNARAKRAQAGSRDRVG